MKLRLSLVSIFLRTCQIIAIIVTYQQVTNNVQSYLEYASTLNQHEYLVGNRPFPNILICSKSMHSKKKSMFFIN